MTGADIESWLKRWGRSGPVRVFDGLMSILIGMDRPTTVILTNGGIGSVVATGSVMAMPTPPHVVFLHLGDGRVMAKHRREFVLKQAQYFGIEQWIEHQPARVTVGNADRRPSPWGSTKTRRVGLIFTAMVQAIEIDAQQVIWPIHVEGDVEEASRLTEQMVLLAHLLEVDQPNVPQLETPLLELADQQVIELGGQLDTPWKLAWSCQFPGDKPCRVCDACRRRQRAFESAGVVDPSNLPVSSR